jgi:hypothetical protein
VVPETSYGSSVALPQRHGTYEVSLIGIVALPEVFS